ncbi:Uncharacterised protein [Mycobacteroides abscessus subsp. abscessus]|nr:Uncharacterised protein [Mycobacteroides abscessus subsp. abscessus]
MLEFAFRLVSRGLGQGQPQLDSVQGRGVVGRDLGVADPVTCGHEVDLAGEDEAGVAAGVDVLDGTIEEPAHRLQSRVRMRGDIHAAGAGDVIGAVVVDEAPRSDEGALALRQSPVDGHRPRSAQRHVAGGDDLDRGPTALVAFGARQTTGSAHHLVGKGLSIAHGGLPLSPNRGDRWGCLRRMRSESLLVQPFHSCMVASRGRPRAPARREGDRCERPFPTTSKRSSKHFALRTTAQWPTTFPPSPPPTLTASPWP